MKKTMKLCWKPHTALPRFDTPTTLLLAYPPEGAGDISFLAGIYCTDADGELRSEVTGDTADAPFFWVTEDELLEGLPC